ncbi:hypothetical protein ACROYT_G014546 [Oculina patagonica]
MKQDLIELMDAELHSHRNPMHPGYSFTGDNVDMKCTPLQMTLNRNKDHHMFQIAAFKNCVLNNRKFVVNDNSDEASAAEGATAEATLTDEDYFEFRKAHKVVLLSPGNIIIPHPFSKKFLSLDNEMHFSTRNFICRVDNGFVHSYNLYDPTTFRRALHNDMHFSTRQRHLRLVSGRVYWTTLMVFHLLPSLFLDKIKCESRVAPSPVIIVVSLFNALIKDQIRERKEGNMKATVLSANGKNKNLELDCSDANPAELRDAKYQIVFAHPRAFLSCKKGIKLLQSETYQQNVYAIVIDEAHCILECITDLSTVLSYLLIKPGDLNHLGTLNNMSHVLNREEEVEACPEQRLSETIGMGLVLKELRLSHVPTISFTVLYVVNEVYNTTTR